jgi:hypothetical protein
MLKQEAVKFNKREIRERRQVRHPLEGNLNSA